MSEWDLLSRKTLLAAVCYVCAAALFTWPLVFHVRTLLGAVDLAGDASLNLWALGWDLRVLSEHPSWLLTGRVFDANIFFPAPHTLAYSDHLLLQALALWPIHALTGDLVLCYNLLLIGSLAAAALAMHLLTRALTGSEAGAYVAGLIFGFAPYHFAHLGHIQLQALYFLPLSFLFLHRVFERQRAIDTVAFGGVLGLQAVSSMYYGIMGGIGVAFATVTLVVLTGRLRDWRLMRRLLAGVAVAVVVMLPWAIPYVLVHREAGAGRTINDAARGGAVLASYVQAPPTNLLYGRTGWLRPGPGSRLARRDHLEQDLFPGFCALLLAVLGATTAAKRLRKTAGVYVIVAMAGVVLSFGPDGIRPLYSLLYQGLFGMAAIRATPRFAVLALCGIAVLAAVAIRTLEERRQHSQVMVVLALLAIGLEYSNGSIGFPQPPALTSNAGRWIRDQPGTGAVVCVPVGIWSNNTPCMLQSLEHRRPVVNGYSGLYPPFWEALLDTTSRLPSAESLVALHGLGVEFIVSDQPLAPPPELGEALVERVRFETQRVYQLRWSPEIDARVSATLEVPPPEPGPVPFAVGESAVYRLRWTSGPVDVPAGEATISVAPPQGPEAYRFGVLATTAPWVSRFYQAIVTLETAASGQLLPLAYREVIDEGKRRIDRQLAFDPARHEVRITSGGTSISLPVAVGGRDPISALFYVRTLALEEGAHFTLPISDNGRRLRLDVTVGKRESIVLDGQTWQAWRVEPRLSERIDRSPLKISAWVSADNRRIPLLVEVAAGFGSARLELTNYRER